MPIARFELPDGRVARFEVPDGTSPEQAQAMIAQALKPKTGEDLKAIAKQRGEVVDPTAEMGTGSRFAAGLGKSVVDTGRGIGQLFGLVSGQDVKNAREQDAPLMNTGAGLAGDVLGTVGTTIAPGGLLKAAGGIATAAKAPIAGQALSSMGNTLMIPKTVGQGLGVGAGLGFIQPATNLGDRAVNTGIGAVGGAAVPAVSAAYSGAKAAAEPFYDAGQQRILGRVLNRAAGDDAASVLANLKGAKELVPGSMPTAGQAANNAGIAALERTAVAIDPTVTTAYAKRTAGQNQARVKVLEDMAGTDGARAFFASERGATADDLYRQAYEKGVDITRDATTGAFKSKAEIAGVKGEITKLLKRPAIQEAVEDARKLAANEGVRMDDFSGSVKGLDYVKRALDDKISKASGNEQRVLVDLKSRLLTTIDKLSPDYAAARSVFQDMSKPINEMDVAGAIAKRSIRPLDSTLMPNQFARVLNDDTARAATGFNKATLENTMSPENLRLLNAIKDDLMRAEFAKNAGRGVGSDTVQKLAYSNLLEGAGVPTWLQSFGPAQMAGNVASRAGDAVYGRANRELASRLAQGLLTPTEAAQFMEAAARTQQPGLLGNSARGLLTPAGLAAPGLLNAMQQ